MRVHDQNIQTEFSIVASYRLDELRVSCDSLITGGQVRSKQAAGGLHSAHH
jgi:hypothetical protein